jgi:5-methylcytosine-specific restriction endonuclease McrA
LRPRAIPAGIQARVRKAAGDRCGYCLSRQEYVLGVLEIEHIVPRARGGRDVEQNLWLACRLCNLHKGAQTHGRDPWTGRSIRLFDPRRQHWWRHFEWTADALQIIGRTATGRATVVALRLNNAIAVAVRRNWIAAGWHPPRPETGRGTPASARVGRRDR